MSPRHGLLSSWLRRLTSDDHGAITVSGLFFFMATCCVGAAAVDVNHFFSAKAQLQAAADSAAHAALYNRNTGRSPKEAKLAAIEVAEFSLPDEVYGEVISEADISFGRYDAESHVFHADPASRSAVLVTIGREQARNNPTPSFLFRMIGVPFMDIRASTVFTIYEPGCLSQGFSANGVIDLQSGSEFLKGFCMHSNSHVKIAQNNFFESGAVVSMPELDDLEIASSGLESNPGLAEALREDFFKIKVLDRIRPNAADPLDVALMTPYDGDRPSYIDPGSAVVNLGTGTNVKYESASAFTQGRVHTRTCTASNNTLTITGPATGLMLSNIVLITNCNIELSGKVSLENVLLYTTNTSATSVKVSTGGGGGNTSGLWIGRPDLCAPGYAAQIFTRGGFKNSAALYMYGSHLLTLGPVVFASNATGEGATVTTDSTISGNSNLLFWACPPRTEENFVIPYFRMAA